MIDSRHWAEEQHPALNMSTQPHRRSGVSYAEGEAIRPTNLGRQEIEEYAGKVIEAAKLVPGTDLKELIKKFKGRCSVQTFGDWKAETGSVFVHGAGDFDVLLPDFTSPLRDQFTMGHELGHYFLHSQMGKYPLVANRFGRGRVEWEANAFAAALLMPKEKFIAEWNSCGNLLRVAATFFVSTDAARVRKEVLIGK